MKAMNALFDLVARILHGVWRLLTLLLLGGLVLGLLLLGISVALLSVLWSLLRGKKPAMFTVFQAFTQAARQFRRWPRSGAGSASSATPGAGPWANPGSSPAGPGDVVDVQAHEVRPSVHRPPEH